MSIMLSAVVGAIAFSAPAQQSNLPSKLPSLRDSRLLALRGGGVDPITTLATLNVVSGLGSWIAPKESIAMYGVKKEVTAYELFWLRAIAGVNFASAVRSHTRRQSPHAVHS